MSSLASVYHRPEQSFLLDDAEAGRVPVSLSAAPAAEGKGWEEGDGGAQEGATTGAAHAADPLDVLDLIGGGAAAGEAGVCYGLVPNACQLAPISSHVTRRATRACVAIANA